VGLFEFLMILASVVIGFGMTELLNGAADLLRARDGIRTYWIHTLFQGGVFFALLQQWWEFWDMQGVVELSFVVVLVVLVPPIVLVLIAKLLYPPDVKGVDLEAYYYRQAPLLWGLVVVGTVEGTFLQPFFFDERILHVSNIAGLPMIACCTALATSKSRRVHSVLAPAMLVLVVLDTILAAPAISTG